MRAHEEEKAFDTRVEEVRTFRGRLHLRGSEGRDALMRVSERREGLCEGRWEKLVQSFFR